MNQFTIGATKICGLIVKTWHTFELQVKTSSPIYPFIKPSPQYDELALESYKVLSKHLPIAVTLDNNANFWLTLLQLVRRGSALTSYIPGPVGTVSAGINSLATAIESLTV